jgi:hypothetical protein
LRLKYTEEEKEAIQDYAAQYAKQIGDLLQKMLTYTPAKVCSDAVRCVMSLRASGGTPHKMLECVHDVL